MTRAARSGIGFGALCVLLVAADAAAFIAVRAVSTRLGDFALPPSDRISAMFMAGAFIAVTGLTLLVVRAYGERVGEGGLMPVIAFASAAMFLFALFFPPVGSADNRWNLLMARSWTVHGLNPYMTTPDDLRADPVFPSVSPTWRNWPAVYGPLWTLLSSLPTIASPDPAVEDLGLRLLCVAAYVAAGLLLHSALAKRRGKGAGPVLAFWLLNPAAAFEIANAGHNEGVLLLFLAAFAAGAALALPRLAAAGLVGAALVKVWPMLLFPSLLGIRAKASEWARIAVFSAFAAACAYAPFWAGRETFSSLYRHASLVGDPYFYAPVRLAVLAVASWSGLSRGPAEELARTLTLLLLLGVVAAAGRLARLRRVSPVTAAIAIFIAYHGVSLNWLQPWHLLAVLPLIVASSADAHLATDLMALTTALGFSFYGAPPWLVTAIGGGAAYAHEKARSLS